MTTFQAIIYAIVHGFTEFLPVSAGAHHSLIPYVTGWPEPTGPFAGALSLGALLALLVYFRHDWASIISSFLQVIIFRKRPMTLDERLPLFVTVTSIPTVAAWYYLREPMSQLFSSPGWIAIALAALGIPLFFADTLSRKNKGMFDWNWLDALLVGIGQSLMFLPGCGRATGALIGALFRNYNREAAAKYMFFASAPLLAGSTFMSLRGTDFQSAVPMPDLSWLSFAVAVIVTMLVGLLSIGGLMKHIQRKGFNQYIVYRCLFAAGIAILIWVRSRGA